MWRNVAAAVIAAALCFIAPAAHAAEPQIALPAPDAWESNPAKQPDLRQCVPLTADHLVPVAPPERPAATSRLRDASIVPLAGAEAVALTGGHGIALTGVRAYLVRAVAKNETSGAFEARLCGPTLWISHGSLGHVVPPSTRAPVVVFLDRAPIDLFVSWSMAQ